MSKAVKQAVFALAGGFLLCATAPGHADGQGTPLRQSTAALNRGDYQKASELASAHLQRSPGDTSERVVLARAQISQGQLDRAFENLRKVLVVEPRSIDALFYLSVIAKEFSKQENQRLFSLAPDSDRAHQILGEAALAASKPEEAESEFGKALNFRPNSVAVLVQLAELKRAQFKLDEAISYYSRAQRLDPGAYEVAAGLGSCYVSKQEFPQAIEWLQKAVALAPDSASGRLDLGNALFQDNQFAAAIPELKASLKLDPATSQAYTLLARAYSKLGRTKESQDVLQKFKELNQTKMHEEGKPDSDPVVQPH